MSEVEQKIENYFPFEEFRSGQAEVIKGIIESFQNNSYYLLEAPTGSGKSVIAYTVARYLLNEFNYNCDYRPYSVICTSTKALQLQYVNTFSHLNDVSYIWSAQNYDCILYPPGQMDEEVHYGDPMCPKAKCPNNSDCPYLHQKDEFHSHSIGISNYHYFLNYRKLTPYLAIMDECHNLENMLCDMAAINISKFGLVKLANNIEKNSKYIKSKDIKVDKFSNKIEKLCKSDNIVNDTSNYIDEFFEHFSPILKKVADELDEANEILIKSKSTSMLKEVAQISKSYQNLVNIFDRYKRFKKSETTWVASYVDTNKGNSTLKPIYVNEFFDLIAKRTDKILFTSATICGPDQFCKDLGITSSYDYTEIESTFPIQNRLVGYKPIGKLNYKNKHELIPEFVKAIDKILDYHKNENGLIHSVSYENAELIKKQSKYKDYILIPDRNQMLDIVDVINKKSKNNRIIVVSPAMLEGVDLYDEISRFQIFIKVPYAFLGDVWVKSKMQEDPKWYARDAVVKIVQGAGRSVRSKDDYAFTYILDENFRRLATTNRELFPNWFYESIKAVNV